MSLATVLLALWAFPPPTPIAYFDPVLRPLYVECQALEFGPDQTGIYSHISCPVDQSGRVYAPGWRAVLGWQIRTCRPASRTANTSCSPWVGPD